MSPVDARVAMLRAEIERDWEGVLANLEKALRMDPGEGPSQAAYVALALDHAYQAFETVVVRIERALGLPERTGASWHAELLADAALPIPSLRPALFPRTALRDWDGLLRFRHFLRHAYAVELEADRLRDNVGRLTRAVDATREPLRSLLDELREGAP